jgi:hypothetical protein
VIAGAVAALVVAALVADPNAPNLLEPLVALAALVILFFLPADAFLVASFVFFGALQLTANYSFSAGPATVYSSDLFVGIVLLRAISPRERLPGPRRLHGFTVAAFFFWALLMLAAMARGYTDGSAIDETVRGGLALFYWPILFLGFSRILREPGIDYGRLLRQFVAAGIVFVAYMFLMRLLGHPFESTTDPAVGHLGQVQTSTGQVFRRDYGFYSAYIVYPIVALIALAKLVYTRDRTLVWLFISFVSTIATFTSLIRSESYGLIAGIAIVLFFSTRVGTSRVVESRRLATAVMLGSVLIGAGALVAAANPSFARAVGERSIPGLSHESATAKENADYRLHALSTGVSIADKHLFGLGILSSARTAALGIDPGYLAHSGPATLLIFLGWPGLIAAALILVGLAIDSARLRNPPWLHPAFLAVIVMLVGNSFGAVGIVGQEFVIGITALFFAYRFAATDDEPAP